MPNTEHLQKLDDVGRWNEWRTRTTEQPELSYSQLNGWALQEVNLQDADLRGASLIRTNLQRVRMARSVLDETVLSNADLTGADLQGASLCNADLSHAKLADANLAAANLTGTVLTGADFSRSNLQNAKGIRFDETYVKEGRLSPYATDRWSILRRSYSGSRLLFHLVLLIVSIAPYATEMLGWNAFSNAEETVYLTRTRMLDFLRQSTDGSAVLEKTTSWLSALKPCLTSNCKQLPVWRLLGGTRDDWWLWILTVCVLMYNVGRGVLIWTVGALRDEEDRSGFTPRYGGRRGYGVLFYVHRIVQMLLVGNLLSLGLHLTHWLSRQVWLVTNPPS